MPAWIILITWITRLVLVLLVGLSIWSVKIMLERLKVFRAEEEEPIAPILDAIRSGDRAQMKKATGNGLKSKILSVLLESKTNSAEAADRTVSAVLKQERKSLEKGLAVLGSLGSNAPFIGLFGTVLGVIQAFGALSYQQGNMSLVMLAIAEALIATAVGLFVAIPAVVAYNNFSKRLKSLLADCDTIRDLFIARGT